MVSSIFFKVRYWSGFVNLAMDIVILFFYNSENAENKDRVGARSGLEAVGCQSMFYTLSMEV